MKTTLSHYRFDIGKADQKAAYDELRENTLKRIGFPVWAMDLRAGYTSNPAAWKFMDKIRAAAGDIDLETEHLFDNQWNAAGLRVFNWAECEYPNRNIKEGYWLEQTSEMREILRNTHKCGYCWKQEPAQKGHAFCPHCLGSSHLTEDQLHLTRMRPVSDTGRREELTEAERAQLLPIYREAQLRGHGERSIAAAKAARAKIEKEYRAAVQKAEAEYEGFTWLLDHGMQIDNVIYYSHTGRFGFGWRQGVSESVKSALLDVLSEFPFPYDVKCADGRTLSGD